MHGILVVQASMKPIQLAAVAAALLSLSACTPMQWVKEDGSATQLASDETHCREEAWREARFRAWAYRPATPILLRDAVGRPFVAWHGGLHDPFSDPFLEESRLAHFCMRSKGYRLEKVEGAQAPRIQPSPANASGGKP